MDLFKALSHSAAGMRAQGTRMRVIAENVANSNSTATTPGELPYRRKLVTFENVLDRELNVELVRTGDVAFDQSDFGRRFDPGHPAADPEGYVLTPNVQVLIEMADMREAQRSYQANLQVIRSSRRMLQRTIDILR
jgi:flagellar basal-body rod protein FlgC